MALIKLIKSRSFSDGTITVKKEWPVVNVPDADAAYYIRTGFFAAMDDVAQAVTEDPEAEGDEEFPFPMEDEGPTAEERLIADLEEMTVKELKAYADKNGIDLAGASKKEAIITTIVAADRKAAEAREALRQE